MYFYQPQELANLIRLRFAADVLQIDELIDGRMDEDVMAA